MLEQILISKLSKRCPKLNKRTADEPMSHDFNIIYSGLIQSIRDLQLLYKYSGSKSRKLRLCMNKRSRPSGNCVFIRIINWIWMRRKNHWISSNIKFSMSKSPVHVWRWGRTLRTIGKRKFRWRCVWVRPQLIVWPCCVWVWFGCIRKPTRFGSRRIGSKHLRPQRIFQTQSAGRRMTMGKLEWGCLSSK